MTSIEKKSLNRKEKVVQEKIPSVIANEELEKQGLSPNFLDNLMIVSYIYLQLNNSLRNLQRLLPGL